MLLIGEDDRFMGNLPTGKGVKELSAEHEPADARCEGEQKDRTQSHGAHAQQRGRG